MKFLYKLIVVTEWACFIIYDREDMSLSALAYEVAHLRGEEFSKYSLAIDILFWFDPDHCRKAYIWHRLKRRNTYRSNHHA